MSSKLRYISFVQAPQRIPAHVAARTVDTVLERARDRLDTGPGWHWIACGILGVFMTAAILFVMNFLMHH